MNNSISNMNELIDQGSVTSQQILVIVLCFIFNMLDGFDITAMAVVASSVSQDLDLTDALLGWIFSFALAGMMFGAMVLAPIADIIGRRALIILSLLLVGVSILLTARADSLTLFIILDTFKTPLYKSFPKLEFFLFSLYETLKDIQLFIKDLI